VVAASYYCSCRSSTERLNVVVGFETGLQLVKRFGVVQEAKEEFWDRWVQEIFPSLLKQMKWYKYKRDARVGNVVLQRDETAVS
jgi:hypothetical protein